MSPATEVRTNVVGLARSLLAIGTLTTLLLNPVRLIFAPLGKALGPAMNTGLGTTPASFSLFKLLGHDLELARWLAIFGLLLVISGWRPRVTGILHWWISFSLTSSGVVIDGGDQLATVLTALLIPLCLADPRRWHWESPPSRSWLLPKVLAESSWWVIRLQIALLYLNAAVAKTGVGDWANGTAAYYWFIHPTYGMPNWLAPALRPILVSPWGVIALTWGAMALEFSLFAGLLARRRVWPLLFWAGIGFHLTIWLVQGLASFFFSMAGALVLYLWHPERPIPLLDAVRLRYRHVSWIAAKAPSLGEIGGEEVTQPSAVAQ